MLFHAVDPPKSCPITLVQGSLLKNSLPSPTATSFDISWENDKL